MLLGEFDVRGRVAIVTGGTAAFLASAASDFIAGQSIVFDGGCSAA